MKPYRREKIASLIQKELSEIIQKELDFEEALVTIMKVEISEDLLHAEISFSIYPPQKEIEVFKILEKNKNFLKRKLFKKLSIKVLPELEFKIQKEGPRGEED